MKVEELKKLNENLTQAEMGLMRAIAIEEAENKKQEAIDNSKKEIIQVQNTAKTDRTTAERALKEAIATANKLTEYKKELESKLADIHKTLQLALGGKEQMKKIKAFFAGLNV